MTEAAHQMASNPLPPGERRPGTVGRATGVEIAALDDDWRPVPAGRARARWRCAARPSSTSTSTTRPRPRPSFRDGWFRTGDVGKLSADGYLSLVGRVKELINRAGEKISPYEVEEVLLSHPAVAEAAAYPVPDEKYGEQVGAVVVLRRARPRPRSSPPLRGSPGRVQAAGAGDDPAGDPEGTDGQDPAPQPGRALVAR